MTGTPRVALVGAGPMGANHARVLAASDAVELGVIVDIDAERARAAAEHFGCAWATDIDAVMRCDAAVIATPTAIHQPQAQLLIEAGKPLLVEKPIAPTLDATVDVVTASERYGTPLMCGFVERFNPAVETVVDMLHEPPLHVVSLRHSPRTPRSTLSVVFDLLIHDIDLALIYMRRQEVSSISSASMGGSVPEVADCTMRFESGGIATLSSSRASQRKVRSHLIAAEAALYDVDLLRQDVTVYQHVSHEAVYSEGLSYRAETMVDIPFVRHGGEPLALQLRHFLRLLHGEVDVDAERAAILPAHRLAAQVETSA